MIIMMSEDRMKGITKRLRRVLRGLGIELKHSACSTTISPKRTSPPATHSRWPCCRLPGWAPSPASCWTARTRRDRGPSGRRRSQCSSPSAATTRSSKT